MDSKMKLESGFQSTGVPSSVSSGAEPSGTKRN
jgi:hypothetical protein